MKKLQKSDPLGLAQSRIHEILVEGPQPVNRMESTNQNPNQNPGSTATASPSSLQLRERACQEQQAPLALPSDNATRWQIYIHPP
jgi:hypothetical protein